MAVLRRVQAKLKGYRAAVPKAACEGRLVPTEAELARKERRSYETGDQLLARILAERRRRWAGRGKYYGSKNQIGRVAIWDGSINPCVHQNHVIKVRPVDAGMSKWILHWLLSPGGRHFVELVASSTSGLYTLSVSKVGDLPICLPSPSEQVRIVAEVERSLSVIEQLDAVVAANLQRATRLRQSILERAFSGRLVPDDGASHPGVEPRRL